MTDTEYSEAHGKGQLDREAAEWCVRLHGEDREEWREPFEAWLKLGALHRAAYNRIEEIYLMGAQLRPDPLAAADSAAPQPPHRRMAGGLALALGLGAVALAWIALPAPGVGPGAPKGPAGIALAQRLRVTTGAGELRLLTLRDGSTVSLGGGSSLTVAFDGKVRRVELVRGSGVFTVAPARQRFVVAAGGGTVTALGTRFEVRMDAARQVHVRLIEGHVEIRAPASSPGPRAPARLEPGQSLTYPAEPAPNRAAARASEQSQPVTVGELVDLANARPDATLRIRIDPTLRATRLGGRFQVRDPAIVAEQLAIMFGLEINRTGDGVLALTRRP